MNSEMRTTDNADERQLGGLNQAASMVEGLSNGDFAEDGAKVSGL